MSRRLHRWVSIGGFLVGGAAGLAAVLAVRVPAGDRALGAEAVFVSSEHALVGLPADHVLQLNGLEAGESASGELHVRNASGVPLAIRIRVRTEPHTLDGRLHVELHDEATRLFSGALGRLRRNSARRFLIAAGDERTLGVRAWLPEDARGYRGRIVKVTLDAGVQQKAELQ
jgi:hypothetical protein